MADIAELIVALRLQDGVSRGLGNLNRELRGMQGGLSQVGRGIGQVGSGLSTIATRGAIAAAAGLTAVVTAAVSFESAFAGVRKTVDATETEFGTLEDRLREMARSMPISFEELAAITEQGGALGIAFEGLDEFTKVVADLAATTDLTADTAATSLGVLGNVLGLSADDFDNFGSALVDLGNKGASTESQILGIAERAGAAGDLIGLSADQVLGFGSAAANMGIEVEAGGSALQRFFIDALTAVETGGDDLETFARTAGVSAESFRDSFREDAGAALNDFIIGLGQLPEAVQIETLADLGFNDIRITRLLLGLAGDADNLTESLNIAAEAFAANSALGVEAAKRYGTAASQIQVLKNNVTDAAVVIGEQLLPIVAELTTELVAFINKPETQRGIKEFGENLASGIRSFIEEVRKADLAPLLDTLKGAAAIARAAFDAFRSLPAPIQQLALAAIVANKVTGGAVGGIAAGLGNILRGVIKIGFERGSSPANPLFVKDIGLPGGPGGGPAGRGGGKFPLIGVGGAIGAALILSGSDNPNAEMNNKQLELTRQLNEGIITATEASRLWAEAYGETTRNPFIRREPNIPKSGRRHGRGDAFGIEELQEMIARVKAATTLPDTAVLRNENMGAVLPDTAMLPVTTALTKSDTASATRASAHLAELMRSRFDTGSKLLNLAAKYDSTNAKIGTTNSTLAGINSQLSSANSKLASINAKDFSPTIKVENKISSTVITNNIAQGRAVAGTRPTAI